MFTKLSCDPSTPPAQPLDLATSEAARNLWGIWKLWQGPGALQDLPSMTRASSEFVEIEVLMKDAAGMVAGSCTLIHVLRQPGGGKPEVVEQALNGTRAWSHLGMALPEELARVVRPVAAQRKAAADT